MLCRSLSLAVVCFCFQRGQLAASAALETFRSNLPLVIIDTHGQSVTERQRFPVTVSIVGTTNGRSSFAGPVEYQGRAEFNIRGNSSRAHPKKAYRLELQTETGADLKVPLLGMPAESDWILFPAFTDKTLVRDALAYELWRAMGHYGARTRYVELFVRQGGASRAGTNTHQRRDSDRIESVNSLSSPGENAPDTSIHFAALNRSGWPFLPLFPTQEGGEGRGEEALPGWPLSPALSPLVPHGERENGADPNPHDRTWMRDYAGVYLLMEKIKRGKDRVRIQKSKPDGTDPQWFTGGFIFKKDRPNSGERGFMSSIGVSFVYEDPKEKEITPEQQAWLKTRVDVLEMALFGSNFSDPNIGYAAYLDVDSFIDYHWMVEVTKNIDGYWFSQFFHMDRGGKLKAGPIWDYDLSFGNVFYHDGYKTNGWRWERMRGTYYKWYARLFEDPDFLQRYIDRWSELRANVLATSNVLGRVDALVKQIGEAQVRNYTKWTNLGVYVHPNRFIGRTYQEEVGWLKDWITGRLAWIDSQGFPEPKVAITGSAVGPSTISLSCETGQIFYTTNGFDPRVRGAEVAPGALEYRAPVALPMNATLIARVRSDYDLWSAPVMVKSAPP
jgi:hypothetical protein